MFYFSNVLHLFEADKTQTYAKTRRPYGNYAILLLLKRATGRTTGPSSTKSEQEKAMLKKLTAWIIKTLYVKQGL